MVRTGSVFLLIALSSLALCAQVNSTDPANNALITAAAWHSADNFADTMGSRLAFREPLRAAAAPPPSPSPSSDQPPIEGSMVGYIDNGIVGSNVRLRFDYGFDDNTPDRAEFFYAQCACDGGTARGPKPGLATAINFQQLYMRAEIAPVKHLSFLFDLPWRFLQPQQFAPATVSAAAPGFSSGNGLSDVQAGVKLALLASPQQYLTFQFIASFPSGDSTKGLGTAHYSIVPSLLYFHKLTDRLSVEGQVGDSHPIGGDTPGFAGDVFDYGIGPSFVVYRGETVRFAPVVELVGWRVLGGMENNAALLGVVAGLPLQSTDGINIVNMKVGARTSVGKHDSFYLGFGQALTHDLWYKHIIRLEYRRAF